jgi:hypothetical protein
MFSRPLCQHPLYPRYTGPANDAAAAKSQVAVIQHGQSRPVRKAAKNFIAGLKVRKKKSIATLKRRVKRLKRAPTFWHS